MALVKTGTFRATVLVKNLPAQFVPGAATAVANPTPFILTNNGRVNGAVSDLIIVNNIAVEPTDGNDATTAVAVGSVAMYLCTVTAAFDGSLFNECAFVPFDSVDGIEAGLKAYSGAVGGITARTLISGLNMSPSYFSAAGATVAQLYGSLGKFRESPAFPTNSVEPQGIDNGQAFQIRKPETGMTDAVLIATVTVMTASGKTYLVEGLSGNGSDILTIFNNTGARLRILEARIDDWYRFTSVNQRYEVIVSTSNLRVDTPANVVSHDSSKALPSWVAVGGGFYMRESTDLWIDTAEIVDLQIPVSANVYPGAAHTRANRPLNSGKSTSKYLRSGKSLVFVVPTNSVMNMGSHDIIVTFSTYAEEVTVGTGGEYSYAY